MISAAIGTLSRDCPVAIMGSTPEFRDLAISMGFNRIVVVDRSDEFSRRMTHLMSFSGRDVEEVKIESWQEHFTGASEDYGAILSDLTLGNIPYVERRGLYDAIRNSLLPGGIFIDKVLTNEASRISMSEIRARFGEMPVNLETVNRFNCLALFCSDLYPAGELDSDKLYDQLSAELGQDPRLLHFNELCQRITPRGMRWHYGRPWSEVAEDYVTGMELICRVPQPETSPYWGHAYQFIHKRRSGN